MADSSSLSALINAVRGATTHSALSDAYMAARRPCREGGRMGELFAANAEAEARLPEWRIEPLVMLARWG